MCALTFQKVWACVITLLLTFTRSLSYCASKLIPRNKRIWVFGAWFGQKFADNPKYLFLYTLRNHPEIRPIWLTRNKSVLRELKAAGYEAYHTLSAKGFFYTLRAGCLLICCSSSDVNPFSLGGGLVIQMWHGTPLKKIGLDDTISSLPQLNAGLGVMRVLPQPVVRALQRVWSELTTTKDYFYVAASEECAAKLGSAFKPSSGHVFVTGYPRNDALFDAPWLSSSKCDYLDTIRAMLGFKYLFVYLPTHRKAGRAPLDMFQKYGFSTDVVERTLAKLDAILVVKAHYYHGQANLVTECRTLHRIFAPSEAELPDVYPLLKETDVLITDYSSVYFDYLLLDRPVIFAPFDLDEYVERDRELYYDYEEVTPGPKAKDWPELLRLMEQVIATDQWGEQRKVVRDRFNTFRDGKSSERVFRLVADLLSGGADPRSR